MRMLSSTNYVNSDEQTKRLSFLKKVLSLDGLDIKYEESKQFLDYFISGLKGELSPKVRLTLNSTIIPFEKIKSDSKRSTVLEVSLSSSYTSVKTTHLLNTIRLFRS